MGLFDKKPEKEKAEPRGKPADFSKVESARRADFSNVESSSSSTAPERPGSAETGRTYTVVSGDSLSRIAQRELGDAGKWRSIYEANRDEIKDPDLIFPGQVLKLPPRE